MKTLNLLQTGEYLHLGKYAVSVCKYSAYSRREVRRPSSEL